VRARLDQSQRVREQALVGGASGRQAEALAGTVPVPWSLAELREEWNRAEHTAAPWWAANSKEAYHSGLDALARALDGWSKAGRGEPKGRKVGFPRHKKLGARRSFRVTTGSFGVIDGRHVRLPRVGVIGTKEPTTKLAGPLDAGTARIMSATVSDSAGRWYVSFGAEIERRPRWAAEEQLLSPVVGVDVGVSSLAVLSTGEMIPNPRHLSRYARRTARLHRGSWSAATDLPRDGAPRSAGGTAGPVLAGPMPRWPQPGATGCTS
jgi:putative transposase